MIVAEEHFHKYDTARRSVAANARKLQSMTCCFALQRQNRSERETEGGQALDYVHENTSYRWVWHSCRCYTERTRYFWWCSVPTCTKRSRQPKVCFMCYARCYCHGSCDTLRQSVCCADSTLIWQREEQRFSIAAQLLVVMPKRAAYSPRLTFWCLRMRHGA